MAERSVCNTRIQGAAQRAATLTRSSANNQLRICLRLTACYESVPWCDRSASGWVCRAWSTGFVVQACR